MRLKLYKVIDTAVKYGKVIEITTDPHRLDLDWRYIKYTKEKGVKLSVNPDAQDLSSLYNIIYEIGIAMKDWLEKSDLINAMETDVLEVFIREV